MRKVLAVLMLLVSPLLMASGGNKKKPVFVSTAVDCNSSDTYSDIVLWINWDDDTCTSDLTSYTPDANDELSSDATISQLGSGTGLYVSDDVDGGTGTGGLSGSACAVWNDQQGATDADFFWIQNHTLALSKGRVGIEIQVAQNDDCNGAGDPWPCCNSSCETPTDDAVTFFGNSNGTRGPFFTFDWADGWMQLHHEEPTGQADELYDTDGSGICDTWINDGAVHILEFAYDFSLGTTSEYIQLYVDSVKCDEHTELFSDYNFSLDYLTVGFNNPPSEVDPTLGGGTYVIDRVGASDNPDEDFYNLWVTNDCNDYVAP